MTFLTITTRISLFQATTAPVVAAALNDLLGSLSRDLLIKVTWIQYMR